MIMDELINEIEWIDRLMGRHSTYPYYKLSWEEIFDSYLGDSLYQIFYWDKNLEVLV